MGLKYATDVIMCPENVIRRFFLQIGKILHNGLSITNSAVNNRSVSTHSFVLDDQQCSGNHHCRLVYYFRI